MIRSDVVPSGSAIVPLRRGDPQVRFTPEQKARCFELYATAAGRNPANVVLLYAEEVEEGEPVPSRQTVWTWAKDEQWDRQANDLWRNTKGRSRFELQVLTVANAVISQRRLNAILMGTDPGDPAEKVITLKGIELAMRQYERIPQLTQVTPPEETEVDTAGMTRDEIEAKARQALKPGTERRG
jgi:hypothetical protein